MRKKAEETLADQVRRYQREAEQDRHIISLLQQIDAASLPEPDREVTFHPQRKWRFDCAWPMQKIALEVEGGTWNGGRHVRGEGYEKDCEKYSEAAILGWCVIRATSRMVENGKAVKLLEKAINARK